MDVAFYRLFAVLNINDIKIHVEPVRYPINSPLDLFHAQGP
jgi:hypothetical protein